MEIPNTLLQECEALIAQGETEEALTGLMKKVPLVFPSTALDASPVIPPAVSVLD